MRGAGVRLVGLTKRYGDVGALESLSLDIAPGELVSLLGPSGCGKTTTLRLVAGFLTPEAGEIWVGDRRLSSPDAVVPPERRQMAMIFQSYALWPHMTVAQNVAYGLRFRREVSRAERARRVAEMLKVVQLSALEARALARDPDRHAVGLGRLYLVVQGERQAERVEARPQVGGGGGDADVDAHAALRAAAGATPG